MVVPATSEVKLVGVEAAAEGGPGAGRRLADSTATAASGHPGRGHRLDHGEATLAAGSHLLATDHTQPTLPRTYIYCKRITPEDRFGPFARRAKSEPGWKYFEIDASHSPNG